MILPQEFFHRDTLVVACELLGKKLVLLSPEGTISGIINETEVYVGLIDPASHAYRGKTARTRHMFKTYGHAYVYFIYGMHDCLNFTTEAVGTPGAVLIRSVIPLEGIDIMKKNRGTNFKKNLTNGPGKLCKAFGITTMSHNGLLLSPASGIYVEDVGYAETDPMRRADRNKGGTDKDWRFWF